MKRTVVAIRTRLTGVLLPWGAFHTAAYADDVTLGLGLTDIALFFFPPSNLLCPV